MTGSTHGNLFLMDIRPQSLFASSFNALNNLWTIWNRRLGHVNNDSLISLFKIGCLEASVGNKMLFSLAKSKCENCWLNKSHILCFPIHCSRATASFDMIHSNVLRIAPHLSRMGYKYYIIFIPPSLYMDIFLRSESSLLYLPNNV